MRHDEAVGGRDAPRRAWSAWGVHAVVPARGATGKTRLRAAVGMDHARLARALTLDTVAAALASRHVRGVLVVTPDTALAAALPPGVRAVREPIGPGRRIPGEEGPGPERRLLAAVQAGLGTCPADAPAAVLLGDLPALRAHELDEALGAARAVVEGPGGRGPACTGPACTGPACTGPACTGPACAGAACAEPACARAAFVPDASGTGTVLLVGARPSALDPAFGRGSAAAHQRTAARLEGRWPGLRTDVDTADDLLVARRLGVGPHTAGVLGQP